MPLPAVIVGALAVGIVPLVVKVLSALGIGIVTYTGMEYALSSGVSFFETQFSGLPATAVQILYMLGFHQGISMLFAAYSASIAIKVAMGAFTRFTVTS